MTQADKLTGAGWLLMLALSTVACGKKGPLYLPPEKLPPAAAAATDAPPQSDGKKDKRRPDGVSEAGAEP